MAIKLFSQVIFLILILLYLLNYFIALSRSSNDFDRCSAYECGFEPFFTNTRIKYNIIYWIIAILYLIFDLEIILIFPLLGLNLIWDLQFSYLIIYYIFFLILTIGFLFEWKLGKIDLT